MSTCTNCGNPCRGKCARCHSPLCASCKPSGRGTCPVCPRGTKVRPLVQSLPYYSKTPEFEKMTKEELIAFADRQIAWLTVKREREYHYVQRRAQKGIHTPTDEVYLADQQEEIETIAFYEFFKKIISSIEP